MPEWLLDNDPPPRPLRLCREAGAAEMLDYFAEEAVCGGEIEQDIVPRPGFVILLCQERLELAIGRETGEVALEIAHAA